jgi:HSP20 family protein
MKEQTLERQEEQIPETRENARTLVPPVDIFETDDGLAVVADMPGVDKESIGIDVDKNVLTIRGTAKSGLEKEIAYREFELLNFHRQFQLSDKVDVEKIKAEMKYGVLTVHLPRVAEQQPKKIEVKVA